jgi:hypothetical protein
MSEVLHHVHSAYEVVKTVGFELEATGENGGTQRFKMRIDVVKLQGEDGYAPMIWQIADAIGDVLMLHTAPSATPVRGNSPEEVVAAVLKSFASPPEPREPAA